MAGNLQYLSCSSLLLWFYCCCRLQLLCGYGVAPFLNTHTHTTLDACTALLHLHCITCRRRAVKGASVAKLSKDIFTLQDQAKPDLLGGFSSTTGVQPNTACDSVLKLDSSRSQSSYSTQGDDTLCSVFLLREREIVTRRPSPVLVLTAQLQRCKGVCMALLCYH